MDFIIHYGLHYGPRLCESWIPGSRFSDLTEALLCGSSLEPSEMKELFVAAGLIHILVVSGAHLHFFERCLFFVPYRARLILLLGYCWLTGFGAPIVRSFARHIVEWVAQGREFSRLQKEGFTALAVLSIVPLWWDSRSFLMSWMCALALAVPFRKESTWGRSALVFLFLYAFCLSSPLTIAFNAILSPVVGFFMFPLALASVAAPLLSHAMDIFWLLLISTLQCLPLERSNLWLETRWLVALPWLANFLLVIGEIHWRRRSSFSSRSV